MSFTSLRIIMLMWQFGLIDTFTAVNFIYNAGAQYASVVVASMAEGNITGLPRLIFEPIAGFGVSYQFIQAATTAAERRARITTIAALLSASTATSIGFNPAANAGIGGAIAAHISYMRLQNALDVRGGAKKILDSVKIKNNNNNLLLLIIIIILIFDSFKYIG